MFKQISASLATVALASGIAFSAATPAHAAVYHGQASVSSAQSISIDSQMNQVSTKINEGLKIFMTKVLQERNGVWSVNAAGASEYAPGVSISQLQRVADAMNSNSGVPTHRVARPGNATEYASCVVAGVVGIPLTLKDAQQIGNALYHHDWSGAYHLIVNDVRAYLYSNGATWAVKQELLAFLDANPAGLIAKIAVSAVACIWD